MQGGSAEGAGAAGGPQGASAGLHRAPGLAEGARLCPGGCAGPGPARLPDHHAGQRRAGIRAAHAAARAVLPRQLQVGLRMTRM